MEQKISSMAVLPFVNATSDANNEFLSDGLTEDLIGTLSQLPNMKVMARSTVFRFKGKEDDPAKVGESLNVDAVLTGKITRHSDNVITADLPQRPQLAAQTRCRQHQPEHCVVQTGDCRRSRLRAGVRRLGRRVQHRPFLDGDE
jgi:hypothetical protein